jgi:hypothetical protein
MDLAASLFGQRDHSGYIGKEEHLVSLGFQISNIVQTPT